MHLAVLALQVIVALVLLDVWLLRSGQPTEYRGANAQSMREEFAVYGLPPWMMYLVGALKVAASVGLLLGLWFHAFVFPAALVIALLMVGALIMHLKVRDSGKKSIPAVVLLLLSIVICSGATLKP